MAIFQYIKWLYRLSTKLMIISTVFGAVILLFFYFITKDKNTQVVDPIKENQKILYKTLDDYKKDTSKEGKARYNLTKFAACSMLGEACTDNPLESNFEKTLLGGMANMIAFPYANPPASGLYWAYSGLQNAGFVPKTYAAEGIGFAAIRPLSVVWKVLRDLAYLFMVLVLLVIGFMIMFRAKINAQTVITVENALPRIVMALIFITFSFPIAGFMIDLMYVMIVLIISVLSSADPTINAGVLQNQFLTAKFSTLWDNFFVGNRYQDGWPLIGGLSVLFDTGNAVASVLPVWIHDAVRSIALAIWVPFVAHLFLNLLGIGSLKDTLSDITVLGVGVGRLPEGPLGILLGVMIFALILPVTIANGAGWIMGLLIFFTLFFLLFRIFFLLLTTYLRIIMYIILSPIILMFIAVPGRKVLSWWLRNLAVNLMIFPLVIGLLVIGRVLVNLQSHTDVLMPDRPGVWTPPFLYGIDPRYMGILIGMGIIMMIPEFIKYFKEVMGVKGSPLNPGINTFFAGAGVGLGGTMGSLTQFRSLQGLLFGTEVTKRGLLGTNKVPEAPKNVIQSGKQNI